MMMRWMMVAALVVACGGEEQDGPEPAPTADCGAACANLQSLGCPAGDPTPDGATCEEVCVVVQEEPGPELPLRCIIDADSCDAADDC